MLVSDILNITANFSLGLDFPTPDDLPIYLRYLNLAHFEAYRYTALINPFLNVNRETLDVDNGIAPPLSNTFFSIRKVYRTDTNKPLIETSYDEIIDKDPSLTQAGFPDYWYFINNSLNVWPLWTQAQGVGIIYNRSVTPLNLNDDLSPPYPVEFHPVLADGTAYFLFQGEEAGFKNDSKMKIAQDRWNKGKADLYNYLFAVSRKKVYSTYSRI